MSSLRWPLAVCIAAAVTWLGSAKLEGGRVYFADFENNLNDTSGFGTALNMAEFGSLSYSTNTPLGSGKSLMFGPPKSFGWVSPGGNTKLELRSFTIEAWVNLASLNATVPGLRTIFAYEPAGADEDGRGYQLTVNSNGQFGVLLGRQVRNNPDSSRLFFQLVGNTSLSLNAWHHVAVTFDEPTATAQLFVDGMADSPATFLGPLVGILYLDRVGNGPNPKTAYIGIAHNATNTGPISTPELVREFTENSLIDRIQIHDDVLSAPSLDFFTSQRAAVPEPSGIALFSLGCAALSRHVRRRRP